MQSKTLSDGDLSGYFDTFRISAFRLETLQYYSVPFDRELFQNFLEGQKVPDSVVNDEWWQEIAAGVRAGKTYSRVHIVDFPLSDYVRYEMQWGYKYSSQAGEDIHLLDSSSLGSPQHDYSDFWLFDDEILIDMVYDSEGEIVERVLVTDSAKIDQAVTIKHKLIETGKRVDEYLNNKLE